MVVDGDTGARPCPSCRHMTMCQAVSLAWRTAILRGMRTRLDELDIATRGFILPVSWPTQRPGRCVVFGPRSSVTAALRGKISSSKTASLNPVKQAVETIPNK